ncbi:MAG: homoserine dehydrogenase [Clostridia bacterium]|nr:homoserine dehydrogenase [Clostridia bacterium]
MIQVAVMGHGVVGSGVTEILLKHSEEIKKKVKEEIYIKKVLDLRDFPDSPIADRFTKNFDDIINDDEIKIVVEVMGGLNPAYTFVKSCLEHGKSVVTSNKELVAAKGAELLKIAEENNLNFLFEASVGGGIPIIRPLNQCLAANDVYEIDGILNGTTNYILNKMIKESQTFEDALARAQQKGYAERNPAADVEGHDACRKICILASLVFGKHFYPESVHTEGITNVSLTDVEYASAWGGAVKLIGSVKVTNGKQEIIVAPMFVSNECQLSSVDGVFNAILVKGDSTGDVVFYGKGAGKLPTASAVVADVMDCVTHQSERRNIMWEDGNDENILPFEETAYSMYVLANTDDKESAFAAANEAFGSCEKLERENAAADELAFITPVLKYADFEKAAENFEKCGAKVVSNIRIAVI